MTTLQKKTILIIILSFISCKKNDDYLFGENRFEDIESLKLNEAIKTENRIGSRQKTCAYVLEGYYCENGKDYNFPYPKVYEKKQGNFNFETFYFYKKEDSLVKVIFYKWTLKKDTLKKLNISQIDVFKVKIDSLKTLISNELGELKDSASYNDMDRYKWERNDLKAYLYFEYPTEEYKAIRMEVYKDKTCANSGFAQ